MADGEPDDPEDGAQQRGDEQRQIDEQKSGSPRVVHAVIREEGEQELARPATSLIFSGLVAGVAMNASVLAKTYLRADLPDVPWRNLVEAFGYTFGFLIVVLSRMQLFTESTVTAVLPVAMKPNLPTFASLLRLWALVFLANMAGTMLVAAMLHYSTLLEPPQASALMDISREVGGYGPARTVLLGIPSGFLIGAIAWMLPSNRGGSEFFIVFVLTYLIGIAGFSHVVAGATEAWMLWLGDGRGFWNVTGDIVLPSLIGNVVGGTVLFAALAHGQVRNEIEPDDAN